MPQEKKKHLPFRCAPAVMATVCAVVLLAVWGGLLGTVRYDRQETIGKAHSDAANLARAFGAHVESTLNRLDRVLLHLREEYRYAERDLAAGAKPLLNILAAEPVLQISVIDRSGFLGYSSLAPATGPVDLSDREHFRGPRDAADDDLFIGRTVSGRVSGKWSIQLARKIIAPDGSFDGVMVLSVDPEHFASFYRAIDAGREGVVTLIGRDRYVRAQASGADAVKAPYDEPLPSDRPYFQPDQPDRGAVTLTGRLDGITRIGAYRRLTAYPLVVLVMLSEQEVLAAFEEHRQILLLAGAQASAFIIAVGLLIVLATRKEAAAARRMAEAEERWRLALEAVGDGVWDWNARTNEVYFSPGWKAMLGFAEDEIANRLEEWDSRVHPDDREAVHAALNRHLSREASVYVNEHRVRCKDGGYRWILGRGVVISCGPDGLPLRVIGTHTDVTRRRRAEDAQRATAAHLKAVLAGVPVGIAIVDRDRRIGMVNPRAAEMLGSHPDNLRGASAEAVHPSMASDQDSRLDAGGTVDDEVRLPRADGTGFWARLIGRRVSPADPDLGTVWIIDDIDNRKVATLALEASHRFQRTLIDTIPLPVFVKDTERRYVDVNFALERWFGLDRASLIGKTARDVVPPEAARIHMEADLTALASRQTVVYDEVVPDAEGGDREMRFFKASFPDAEGNAAGIVGVVIDLTERRQDERALRASEERLRLAVQAAGVGIFEWDVPSDRQVWSPETFAIFGWDPGTPVTVGAVMASYHPEDRAGVLASSTMLRDPSGPGMLCNETRIVRPDKEVRWVRTMARAEFTEVDGIRRTVRIVGAVQDFTDRRNAEEILAHVNADLERRVQERTAQLVQAQKMETMGQLTSGVAHDFNNLLQGVGGCLAALRPRVTDGRARELLAAADQGIERGGRLVQQLLAFARRQALSPKPTDMGALLDGMRPLLEHSMGGLVRIAIEVAEGTWPAHVDRTQAELGLLNLAVNARDAMAAGGLVRISAENAVVGRGCTVEHTVDVTPGEYVVLRVSDTGVGMNAETRARAVEPFFTTKGPGHGSGLGLSMVYGMAAQSGGGVRIDSEPGKGTTVSVYLPRASAEAGRTDPLPAAPTRRGGGTVLLADDDELVRMAVAAILEESGHRVLVAEGGAEALDLFNSDTAVDVLVTDYAMPGMDGATLARAVRALRPDLPILLITGHAERPCDVAGLAFLQKPFRPEALTSELAALLDREAGGNRPAPCMPEAEPIPAAWPGPGLQGRRSSCQELVEGAGQLV
ncbi:PAS domain S-box protein (plasmid) [Skermanella rosea]|uniref:PAS domain S-box protein n=1 Tax=Skermanella rosea TaxID=1817965 RepID=UPI0019334B77|nr:PAS domain S-box protein [Skermanella rosea]UEM07660.1 PAS domain S-box protein [Skermanella rosea]